LLSFLSFKANDRTIVVSKDGKGNFTTIQQAINAAENGSSVRTKIVIKEGIYKEKSSFRKQKALFCLKVKILKKPSSPTMILHQKRIRKEKNSELQVLQRFLFTQMILRQKIFHSKTVQEK
jgi:hypothetical protein